jgi:hypothetical protein
VNPILFAAGAYLLLLPLLKFIPVKLAVKQKVVIASLAFCITILSVIGSEFLPQVSVIAPLLLVTGLTSYFFESKLQKRKAALNPDPQRETLPSAIQNHEPIIYETTDENLADDYNAEPKPIEDLEESFSAEERNGYIIELEMEDNQRGNYDDDLLNFHDRETMSGEDKLNVIEDRMPGIKAETDSFIEHEEEEEYYRLFSGMER